MAKHCEVTGEPVLTCSCGACDDLVDAMDYSGEDEADDDVA